MYTYFKIQKVPTVIVGAFQFIYRYIYYYIYPADLSLRYIPFEP